MTTIDMPIATRSIFNTQNAPQTRRAPLQNPPKVGDVHTITFEQNQRGVDPIGKLGKVVVFGRGVPLGTHKVKIVHVGQSSLIATLDDTNISSLVVGQTYMWIVSADGDRRYVSVAGQRIYVPRSATPDKSYKFVFDGEHPDNNHCMELRARFLNPPVIDQKVQCEAKQLHVSPENMPVWIPPVDRPWPTIKSTKSNGALVQHCAELADQKHQRRVKKNHRQMVTDGEGVYFIDLRWPRYTKRMPRLLAPNELTLAQVREMERLEALRAKDPKKVERHFDEGDGLDWARTAMKDQHAGSQIKNLNLVIEKADPNSRRKFWAKEA